MNTQLLIVFFSLFISALIQVPATASEKSAHGGGSSVEATEHKGHSPEQTAKEMSALFPQPQADLSQQERPTKPELVSPSFYEAVSAGKTTLQWKASTGAEAYHVQVATDANFKWLVSESFDVKNTSYEVSGLEAGKNYYWRVLGSKMSNVSQFTKSAFSSSMFRVK